MIILKLVSKLLVIPALLVTSVLWLIVKALIALYGLCYGLLGLGVAAAMILFFAYQEWMNMIALIVIAVVAFAILFAGTFIHVLLEEVNSGLVKVLRT